MIPTFPSPACGRNKKLIAMELWLLLQRCTYEHAQSVTVAELMRFQPLFDAYFEACALMGMVVGENHPLDVLDE